MLQRQAARYGGRPLFVCGGERWSYTGTADIAARSGGRFAAAGIGKGDRVAYFGKNTDLAVELTSLPLQLVDRLAGDRGLQRRAAALVRDVQALQPGAFELVAPYEPAGNYPLGTNLALYVGPKNFMVEMETMGAFATLKPGQVLKHRETWLLADAKSAPAAKVLRGLFSA